MNLNDPNMSDEDDDFSEDEDTQKDKFLTFHLADEDYAIEIRYVTEIIGIQKITQVPDLPQFLKGVINLRGNVIPVMDVRTRFHIEEREYTERTCIIVVDLNKTSVGLVVDMVSEVVDILEDKIEPPPKIQMMGKNSYILGLGKIGDRVKIILDVNKLLFKEEVDQLAGVLPPEEEE
ncbi:MAG: chemotaxis protein CheW [Nitrospinota bacterium]